MTDSPPDAELRLPADSAYLAVLRTATAGLAARMIAAELIREVS